VSAKERSVKVAANAETKRKREAKVDEKRAEAQKDQKKRKYQ
jgi:hypothetical protein